MQTHIDPSTKQFSTQRVNHESEKFQSTQMFDIKRNVRSTSRTYANKAGFSYKLYGKQRVLLCVNNTHRLILLVSNTEYSKIIKSMNTMVTDVLTNSLRRRDISIVHNKRVFTFYEECFQLPKLCSSGGIT